MKRRGISLAAVFAGFFTLSALAQSPSPNDQAEASELLALSRKIDEQSAKIDALSQQLLRLQQEIAQGKTPVSTAPVATAVEPGASPSPQSGATHVVARGETLTSIARMHKVSIDELQKFNHIENDRKLQIGQTLVIPGAQNAAAPSLTATPTATPNE